MRYRPHWLPTPPPPGLDPALRRRRGTWCPACRDRSGWAQSVQVSSPPRLARTLHVSRTRSQLSAADPGPERAMRINPTGTRRNRLVSCHVRSRRRSVDPEVRPGVATSSHHWTPSRKKNCSVATTSAAGSRGLPRPVLSPSNLSIISATRSCALTLNIHPKVIDTPLCRLLTGALYDLITKQHWLASQCSDLWKSPLSTDMYDSGVADV